MLKTHGRYEYSAITKRKSFTWPKGKRLACYIAMNLEHFSYGEGLGAKVSPVGGEPDVLNYSWRDYGNRVGVWRMLDLFEKTRMPLTVAVNSEIYNYCPEVVKAFRDRKDEIAGHGRTNSEKQSDLSYEKELELIKEATTVIKQHEGIAPSGWLGPWLSNSFQTVDMLKEVGYEYVMDWCHDNQPVWLKTKSGPLLSMPFPEEINDIPSILIRGASAEEFGNMIIDEFDEMLLQSQNQSLVFSISLHPYIVGQPFRLKHLRRALEHIAQRHDEIWFTTAKSIADHFKTVS